ncbi:MAG TPA: NAD(P)-dependent oxidoreductase [Candidatus Polarisedimenticolia bacterium]|jgi:nucleoside-diphosphate-sugar epimerase
MRVLVTGGTGFIGSHFTRRLLEGGHKVNLVVHRTRPEQPEGPSVKHVSCDLEDPTLFRNAGFKCDMAVNMAGLLRKPGIRDESYWKVHYESTKHILEEAAKFKMKHVLLMSTTGVYGATGRTPRTEEGPCQPGDIYERTKLEGERYAMEQCPQDGVELTIARPGLVYGPGDLHLLRLFRGIKGGWFRIVGDGSNLIHPIYIDDLTEALMRCLPAGGPARPVETRPQPRVFNLAGERPVAFGEFCEVIARAVGRKRLPSMRIPKGLASAAGGAFELAYKLTRIRPPLTRETVEFMTSDRAYDISKARRVLEWSPSIGIEEGTRRAVAWYREKGLLN